MEEATRKKYRCVKAISGLNSQGVNTMPSVQAGQGDNEQGASAGKSAEAVKYVRIITRASAQKMSRQRRKKQTQTVKKKRNRQKKPDSYSNRKS